MIRRIAATALTAPTHVHYFRRIGGQWICADPACLTPIAALATPGCDTFCTEPCPVCDARDLALIPGDRHDRP